jgi:hypothetical protein
MTLQRWQAGVAITTAIGAAGVWAADQRWATKAEAKTARADHGKLHQEEAATRTEMMQQLTQTRDEMAALREDLAFLRCFLDPRTDWDAFKQTCVERPGGSLPSPRRVPPIPHAEELSSTAGHSPSPTTTTTTTTP